MTTYSREIESDITSRSRVFGITLGVLCMPTAFMGGIVGACCPLGVFVGMIPVLMWSTLAGFLSAMFLNWSAVPHEQSVGVGVRVGMKTGLIASLIGAGGTVLISTMFAGAIEGGLASSTDPGLSGAGAGLTAASFVTNLFAAAVAVVFGIVFAVVGAVIGAAWKRPSGNQQS